MPAAMTLAVAFMTFAVIATMRTAWSRTSEVGSRINLRRLEAVHNRHLAVHQHEREVLARERAHRLAAVGDHEHVVAQLGEQARRHLLVDEVVLRQKDADPRLGRSGRARRERRPGPAALTATSDRRRLRPRRDLPAEPRGEPERSRPCLPRS